MSAVFGKKFFHPIAQKQVAIII